MSTFLRIAGFFFWRAERFLSIGGLFGSACFVLAFVLLLGNEDGDEEKQKWILFDIAFNTSDLVWRLGWHGYKLGALGLTDRHTM